MNTMNCCNVLSKYSIRNNFLRCNNNLLALFSTSSVLNKDHYKLVVVGGGTGGAAASSVFGSKLGKKNVATIEPADVRIFFIKFKLKLPFINSNYFRLIIINRCGL